MPEFKISAADTALAMEEVERKLGPDALILSTERREGMIEILATNDPDQIEAAMQHSLKKRQEKNKSQRNSASSDFSKLLDLKHEFYSIREGLSEISALQVPLEENELIDQVGPPPGTEFELAINRIKNEIQTLIDNKLNVEPMVSVETQMRVLGFSSASTEELLRGQELEDKIAPILKKFAKLVVQGKDKNFDSSEVIIVCGPERSGKTTLAKKLGKFLPSLDEESPNRVISDASFSDLETCLQTEVSTNITSLFRKKLDTTLGGGRIIFDYDGPMDTLGSFLLRLSKLKEQPKFSLVYTLEVGKSYSAVKELLKFCDLPNLFIALTKMDMLEVSISELSAIFDIKQKIQFFSGLKVTEGGLDFAKVSVMESFLNNLSGQEGW